MSLSYKDQRGLARQLYREGMALEAIAEKLEVRDGLIAYWMGETEHPEYQRCLDEARAQYLAGVGPKAIAIALDVPLSAVKTWVAGLPRQQPVMIRPNPAHKPDPKPRAASRAQRYRIADPALALALSGAWRAA